MYPYINNPVFIGIVKEIRNGIVIINTESIEGEDIEICVPIESVCDQDQKILGKDAVVTMTTTIKLISNEHTSSDVQRAAAKRILQRMRNNLLETE